MLDIKICIKCCSGKIVEFCGKPRKWQVTDYKTGAMEFDCPGPVVDSYRAWDARKPPPPWCQYDLVHAIVAVQTADRLKRRRRRA